MRVGERLNRLESFWHEELPVNPHDRQLTDGARARILTHHSLTARVVRIASLVLSLVAAAFGALFCFGALGSASTSGGLSLLGLLPGGLLLGVASDLWKIARACRKLGLAFGDAAHHFESRRNCSDWQSHSTRWSRNLNIARGYCRDALFLPNVLQITTPI